MRFLPAIIVFGAAGAGYVYTHDDVAQTLSPASWVSETGQAASSSDPEVERLTSAPAEEIVVVAGPDELGLEDVFRFDLTPQIITQRWNRVTTGLGDVRYQGYRVPLVTGTTSSDLAGSLTYYFDAQPRLRRITFLGTTGDPARVVEFVGGKFGFRRAQTGNPRVMTYRTHYRWTGSLDITPAEVLDRRQAETNYQIELVIER
ncbi:MAG TPA: DUF6690 family protein [Planctomycetaceae bacterium]|jgi:hypothetical protein|nr:DUF6690 family protein [Planctomycetaceae bacterium]